MCFARPPDAHRSGPQCDNLVVVIRFFLSSDSSMEALPRFFWEDTMGGVHHILQRERGEQGDPLMPMRH